MALFNQTTKTCSAAIDEIADAIGASGDAEVRTRARRSLNAAIGHFNTRAKWDWTLTEASPVRVVAPFSVGGVTAVSGQSSAACPANHGLAVDDIITFLGVSVGTRVSATAAGGFGMTNSIGADLGVGPQVVTASAVRDYYSVPSDWKTPYQLKTLREPRVLTPIRRRFYGRVAATEYTPSTPEGYDILPITTKGKVRLVPPPNATDVLRIDYYRRIATATADADGSTLDMPSDAEPYLIAYAKFHTLVDKGEGRSEQGKTWYAFAEDGIKRLLAEQTVQPDEDLSFQYGHAGGTLAANSTRDIDWDR